MKPQFKISPFSQYVLRTPLFPLSFYLDLLKNYNSGKSIAIYQNALVKEALSMASPELINELNKWESFQADSFNKHFCVHEQDTHAMERTVFISSVLLLSYFHSVIKTNLKFLLFRSFQTEFVHLLLCRKITFHFL